jgi:hypothetical protein
MKKIKLSKIKRIRLSDYTLEDLCQISEEMNIDLKSVDDVGLYDTIYYELNGDEYNIVGYTLNSDGSFNCSADYSFLTEKNIRKLLKKEVSLIELYDMVFESTTGFIDLDEVLDKINECGIGSLVDYEKDFLKSFK